MTILKKFLINTSGSIITTTALILLPLVSVVVGVIHIGMAGLVKQEMQNSIDIAVVAASADFGQSQDPAASILTGRRFFAANFPEGSYGVQLSELILVHTGDGNFTAEIDGVLPSVAGNISLATTNTVIGVNAASTPTEFDERLLVQMAIAIDVTNSMETGLVNVGTLPNATAIFGSSPTVSRMKLAKHMVNQLLDTMPEKSGVYIGLVPFEARVRLKSATEDGSRFANMVIGAGGNWGGCVYERSGSFELSLDAPSGSTASKFERDPGITRAWKESSNRAVHIALGEHDSCASDNSLKPIIPLSNDFTAIREAMTVGKPASLTGISVGPNGTWYNMLSSAPFGYNTSYANIGKTQTHIGILWASRLLADDWRTLWNIPSYKRANGEAYTKNSKYMVLISDGENTGTAMEYSSVRSSDIERRNVVLDGKTVSLPFDKPGNKALREITGFGNHKNGITRAQANSYHQQLCQDIRAKGDVQIFVIALQINETSNPAALNILRSCASTPASFFKAEDAEQVFKAFKDISRKVKYDSIRLVENK